MSHDPNAPGWPPEDPHEAAAAPAESLEAMRRRHWETLRRLQAEVEDVSRKVVAHFQASGWDADVAAEGLGALSTVAVDLLENLKHMRAAVDEAVDGWQQALDRADGLLDELEEAEGALECPTLDDLRAIFEEAAGRWFPWELVQFAALVNAAVARYAPHEVATNGGGR